MKTFVYHEGAFGDIILSIPCFKWLKAWSHLVHIASRGDVGRFLKDLGVVHEAISSDQAFFASLYSVIDPILLKFLKGFDRAFVFISSKSSVAASAIRSVIPHTRTIITTPPDGTQMHIAHYRLSQLESDIVLFDEYTMLELPREQVAKGKTLLRDNGYDAKRGLVAVHPGSGGKLKCWPLTRYFDLAERVQAAYDVFVIVFTGDAEADELKQAVSRYVHAHKNMFHADSLDLMSASSLLAHCDLYIGNDSGFSHLAGILGCSTIVLFGPTEALRWRPVGRAVEVLSTDSCSPMTRIAVEDVVAKARTVMDKTCGIADRRIKQGCFDLIGRKPTEIAG